MARLLRIVGITVWAVCLPLHVSASTAGDERADEYQVKAAFLFNFARFVSWPETSGPIVIGIAGDDPFGEVVEATIRGKSIAGRPIEVRMLGESDAVRAVNILFISAAEKRRAADLVRRAGSKVLTVGEIPQFIRDGGMIRFFVEQHRVRFQINAQAAEQSGFKIHSQLLSLAAK
jgi:hypothetical protein